MEPACCYIVTGNINQLNLRYVRGLRQGSILRPLLFRIANIKSININYELYPQSKD